MQVVGPWADGGPMHVCLTPALPTVRLLRVRNPSGRLTVQVPHLSLEGWAAALAACRPPGVAEVVLVGAGGVVVEAAGQGERWTAKVGWERGGSRGGAGGLGRH